MEPEGTENIPEPGTPRPASAQRPWLVTKRKGSPPIVMGKPGNIAARFAAPTEPAAAPAAAAPESPPLRPTEIPVAAASPSDTAAEPEESSTGPTEPSPATSNDATSPVSRPTESTPPLPFVSTARPFPVAPTTPLKPATTPARTFPESQASLFRSPTRSALDSSTPEVPTPPTAPAASETAAAPSAAETPTPAPRANPPAPDETLTTLRYIAGALEDMRGRIETLTREERYQQFSPLPLIGAGLEVITLGFVLAALKDWVFAAQPAAPVAKLLFATVFQLAALTAFLFGRK